MICTHSSDGKVKTDRWWRRLKGIAEKGGNVEIKMLVLAGDWEKREVHLTSE